MMPAARARSISFLICASDGAPAATCRLLEPDAAGNLSGAPTLPLTSLALAAAADGSGSPPLAAVEGCRPVWVPLAPVLALAVGPVWLPPANRAGAVLVAWEAVCGAVRASPEPHADSPRAAGSSTRAHAHAVICLVSSRNRAQ